jgi:hypothetical protein
LYEFAKATYELLVRIKCVISKLKKERGNEMHIVPLQAQPGESTSRRPAATCWVQYLDVG